MKYIFRSILFITTVSLIGTIIAKTDDPFSNGQFTKNQSDNLLKPTLVVPKPPHLQSASYILVDAMSGRILAEQQADQQLAPASLTKVMSLYIFSNALKNEHLNLETPVRVSQKAWRMGGSRMFIEAGNLVSTKDLLQGIIVASGNDATVALAEHIAGSEETFVNMMNEQAKQLGMHHTHFTDSTGMPNPEHYTTARDMAKLTRAMIRDFPENYSWFKQKWFTWNKIKQPNRNRLLWRDSSVDGLKTGHTDDAGFCLIASAMRDGMRLIAIIMMAPSDRVRFGDSESLFNYGFSFYKTYKIYSANEPLTNQRIWMGQNQQVPFGVTEDVYVTIPRGHYQNLAAKINLNTTLTAPIDKGKTYGALEINLFDKQLIKKQLVALDDSPVGGVWRRFSDYINLSFHRLLNLDRAKRSLG